MDNEYNSNNEYNYEPYQYGGTPNNNDNNNEEPLYRTAEDTMNSEGSSTYAYKFTTSQTEPEPEPPKKEKKKGGVKKWITCICMAVVFGLVASAVFTASNTVLSKYFGVKQSASNQSVGTTQVALSSDTVTNSDIADVVENTMPSVVSITNLSIQEIQNYFYGTTQYESESCGSGIIIGQNDAELLIVTNNHVVEGNTTLTVTFIDGTNIEAQIKGTDSDRDLAIVVVPLSDIESTTMEAIKIATLGDSDELRVGETTIAIGNALGYGQSVTTGIISALNRTLDDYEGELIQTDAAINAGNSGGALLNANGEVIGINSAKLYGDTVESMGYAIPISDVMDILNELMNRETRTKVAEDERGSLGIRCATVDETYAAAYNMPQGVFVSQVIEGGAAEKAGLESNCIITKIDGTSVDTADELIETLEYYKVGETVELTIQVPGRGGYEEETIEVTLYKMEQ